MTKRRVPIPAELAARVLFSADRTCCVCRDRSKPVQIHHIDDDPSNNDVSNLAVVCLTCHDETQVSGGFGRKLNAEQMLLYRDDWNEKVRHFRTVGPEQVRFEDAKPGLEVKLASMLPEIYKEEGDLQGLISFYHEIGNVELRDRYITEVLSGSPPAWVVAWLARLQGRSAELDPAIFEEALADVSDDYMVEAGLLNEAGRPIEAAKAMVAGILRALDNGEYFNAAYNMRRLHLHKFVQEIFMQELAAKARKGDVWWQYRCLQELEWDSEARELLLSSEAAITADGDLVLRRELARAKNDDEALFEIEKQIAHAGTSAFFDVGEAEKAGEGPTDDVADG